MDVTRESLRPLLDLQQVDLALDRLGQRKADLPEQRALDELNAAKAEQQKTLTTRQEAFDRTAREQARLEGDVQMIEAKISSESTRLYSGEISNPKELAAIQAELDALRRRKNHLEDQLLEVMDAREKSESELNETTTALSGLEAQIADAASARDAASTEIEIELKTNHAAREEIAPRLPEEALELYEKIRPKQNGVAAARLEAGVCRGCGVSLSPVALDVIKRGAGDDIVRCENCRRILVL